MGVRGRRAEGRRETSGARRREEARSLPSRRGDGRGGGDAREPARGAGRARRGAASRRARPTRTPGARRTGARGGGGALQRARAAGARCIASEDACLRRARESIERARDACAEEGAEGRRSSCSKSAEKQQMTARGPAGPPDGLSTHQTRHWFTVYRSPSAGAAVRASVAALVSR